MREPCLAAVVKVVPHSNNQPEGSIVSRTLYFLLMIKITVYLVDFV